MTATMSPETPSNIAADTMVWEWSISKLAGGDSLVTVVAPPKAESFVMTDEQGVRHTIQLQAQHYADQVGAFVFTLNTAPPRIEPLVQREIVAQINIAHALRSMPELTHYRHFIIRAQDGRVVTLDLAMQNYDDDILSVVITLDNINHQAGLFDFVIDGGRTVFVDLNGQTIVLASPIMITIAQMINFVPMMRAITNTIFINDASDADNPANIIGHILTIRQTIALGDPIPAESVHLSIVSSNIDGTLTIMAGDKWAHPNDFHLPLGKKFGYATVNIITEVITADIHYVTVSGDGYPSDLMLSFAAETEHVLPMAVWRQMFAAEGQTLSAITVILRGEDNTILGMVTIVSEEYYYDEALLIAQITVYDDYLWVTVNHQTVTRAKMTVGVFADSGLPAFAVLPPPNPSDGKNYRTTEFNYGRGLDNINADVAYQRGYFGQGVTVAVIDSGLLTTHIEFAGRVVPGYDFVITTDNITDPDGHGTQVAGVIGGAMDGQRFHGVAPSVHIMPLSFLGGGKGGGTDKILDAMEFAISRGVRVINNSWGYAFRVRGYLGNDRKEVLMPVLPRFISKFNSEVSYLKLILDTLNNADVIQVFAAGNEGWNSTTGMVDVYNIDGTYDDQYSLRSIISRFVSDDYGAFTQADANGVGSDASAPLAYPSLIGKWLAVVATDNNDVIASFSNGCGAAKYWCLAAPGVGIRTADSDFSTDTADTQGTSFAAPHVSGALALLISRLPQMPKPVIKAILLVTATDLGDPGVDEVYGHGLVNVAAAITVQGSVGLALGECLSCTEKNLAHNAVVNANQRINLSDTMAHLHQAMTHLSVAFNVMDDYYFGASYQSFINPQTSNISPLGNAATDMLGDSKTEIEMLDARKLPTFFAAADDEHFLYYGAETQQWHFRYDLCTDCGGHLWTPNTDSFAKPFFATQQAAAAFTWRGVNGWSPFIAIDTEGEHYQQFGLQWHKENAMAHWGAEISHIREQGKILGSDFGDGYFAIRDDGQTTQMRVFAHRKLWNSWSGFAEYQWGRGADVDGEILLKQLSSLRFDGWQLGLAGKSAILHGDRLRLSMTKPAAMRGTMQAHHCSATKPVLVEDLQYHLDSDYECDIIAVNIDAPRTMIYALGYELPSRAKVRTAIGLEYRDRAEAHDWAASFALRWAW